MWAAPSVPSRPELQIPAKRDERKLVPFFLALSRRFESDDEHPPGGWISVVDARPRGIGKAGGIIPPVENIHRVECQSREADRHAQPDVNPSMTGQRTSILIVYESAAKRVGQN